MRCVFEDMPAKLTWLLFAIVLAVGCRSATDAARGEAKGVRAEPYERLPVAATDLSPGSSELRTAVFAGGCFWCVEAVFEPLEGVVEVVSGYAGGSADTANYRAVIRGDTGHAEAVRVRYDPARVSYGTLLRVFFTTHDPTSRNRQGADVGPQYRSAVFFANPDEKRVAAAYIAQLHGAKLFPKPIVTTLEPLDAFYPAEDYHQDYARRNPADGYIRAVAQPKLDKLREQLGDLLSDEPARGDR